jgi:hypothetical protein
MSWHAKMIEENQPDSAMNGFSDALLRAHAITVGTKDRVTILEIAPGARRVLVPYRSQSKRAPYQQTALASCWISTAALGIKE